MEFGGSHGNVLQEDLSTGVARGARRGQPNHNTCQPSSVLERECWLTRTRSGRVRRDLCHLAARQFDPLSPVRPTFILELDAREPIIPSIQEDPEENAAMATQTLTTPGQDQKVEDKNKQLRELFADAPQLGKTALENVLREIKSQASEAPPPPIESAGRVGSRLGEVSELTIIVPLIPGGPSGSIANLDGFRAPPLA
jgi:hypothetical protein